MHQRTVIRGAVASALAAANTAAGARVHPNRQIPIRDNELPAILVYALGEEIDHEDSAPRELARDLSLAVDGILAVVDGDDQVLDDLSEQIEVAMHADPYFGGVCGGKGAELTAVDIEFARDGKRLIGRIAHTYNVRYYTFAPEPPADVDLDDFEAVNARYPLALDENGEPDPDVPLAEDDFTVEEQP